MNRKEHIANLKACLAILSSPTQGSVSLSQATVRSLIEVLGEAPFPKTLSPELAKVIRTSRGTSMDLHAAILAHLNKQPTMFMFYATSGNKVHSWKHQTKDGATSNHKAAKSIEPTVYKHVSDVIEVPLDDSVLLS